MMHSAVIHFHKMAVHYHNKGKYYRSKGLPAKAFTMFCMRRMMVERRKGR